MFLSSLYYFIINLIVCVADGTRSSWLQHVVFATKWSTPDIQVGQMCAFRMAHEGTTYRQATDCVPLPLNTTAHEAADLLKKMNFNPATSDLIKKMNSSLVS